jgi:hypothetical protein
VRNILQNTLTADANHCEWIGVCTAHQSAF